MLKARNGADWVFTQGSQNELAPTRLCVSVSRPLYSFSLLKLKLNDRDSVHRKILGRHWKLGEFNSESYLPHAGVIILYGPQKDFCIFFLKSAVYHQ